MTIVKLVKRDGYKQSGDILVCAVDSQMIPYEGSQKAWEAAGEELKQFRRTSVSLPLQESSLVLTSSCGVQGFTNIAHIMAPTYSTAVRLNSSDRERLRNSYYALFSKAKDEGAVKLVLPVLGEGALINDRVEVALHSALEVVKTGEIEVVQEILFTTTKPDVYEAMKSHELYKTRKNWGTIYGRPTDTRMCAIGIMEKNREGNSKCQGNMKKILSLNGIWKSDTRTADLLECQHEADMIMCRMGEFDTDWTSDEATRRLEESILEKLQNSFPEHQGALSIVSKNRRNYVSKSDSKRWMQERRTLLKVGTPVCEHDMTFFRSTDFTDSSNKQDAYSNKYVDRPADSSKNTPPTPRRKVPKEIEDAVVNLFAVLKCDANILSRKSWKILSTRQRREKARLARIAIDAICEVLAPGNKEDLQDIIINGEKTTPTDSCAPLSKMLTEAADLWDRSPCKRQRLIILSTVCTVQLPLLQQFFIGLTSYYHKKARDVHVRGTLDIPKKLIRIRYEEEKLNRLLEFILSPLVVLNLPFDERHEKMDDGTVISMPNLMRLQTIDEVYRMYLSWLDEEGLSHMALKETTAKFIIRLVAPTRRKNLTCVDEKIADGLKAFDEYFAAVTEMQQKGKIDKVTATLLSKQLQSGVSYLRGDFKAHVKIDSQCADHCATYALSDFNSACFANECTHVHDVTCERCSELESTLKLVEELLESSRDSASSKAEKEHFKILHEECLINYILVHEMKNHQIRAALSNQEKTDFLASISKGVALVTLDWAQKQTPLYAREKQSEYYAKDGLSHHISHAETMIDGEPAQHITAHIFKAGEKQDGTAVALVVEDFLKELKQMGIKRVLIRSDCAGCYRNAPLISALYKMQREIGVRIDGLMFSEAQAGKGPCDRGSSLIKGKGRDTVTSTRGKIETKEDFFNALTTGKLLNGVSIHLCTISNRKKEKQQIKDITKYSSFDFENGNEVRLRRHRSIGKGMPLDISKLPPCSGKLEIIKSGGHTVDTPDLFWLTKKSHQARSSNAPTTPTPTTIGGMLPCPVDGCIKEYRSYYQLAHHIDSEKHEFELERKTMHDYCSEMASISLGIHTPTCPPQLANAVTSSIHSTPSTLPQGFAIRTRKPPNKNDARARELVREFFTEKRSNGLKANPHEALIYMKNAKKADGSIEVSPKDRLTITQIKAIFTGLLKKEKPKGKKSKTAPVEESSDDSSDDDEAVPEDFDDTDDEEPLRDLIRNNIDFEMESDSEETKPIVRKRRSVTDR